MQQLLISSKEDRLKVVAILADNGYTVRIGKMKVGSQNKTTVDILDEEVERVKKEGV